MNVERVMPAARLDLVVRARSSALDLCRTEIWRTFLQNSRDPDSTPGRRRRDSSLNPFVGCCVRRKLCELEDSEDVVELHLSVIERRSSSSSMYRLLFRFGIVRLKRTLFFSQRALRSILLLDHWWIFPQSDNHF